MAAWMGGHFERLVRTIKTCLSSAIARKLYNQEEFTTVVEEVENIINNRPLTYQSNDALDQTFTPSQLLWGGTCLSCSHSCSPTPMMTRQQRPRNYVISISSSAWEKHVNHCAERPTHHLKLGSLVMVRHEWPLGRVVQVFPDPLRINRTAEVEEGGRSSFRSVTFLVPLELDCYDDEEGYISETESSSEYNEAASSEADEPPFHEESTTSGHGISEELSMT